MYLSRATSKSYRVTCLQNTDITIMTDDGEKNVRVDNHGFFKSKYKFLESDILKVVAPEPERLIFKTICPDDIHLSVVSVTQVDNFYEILVDANIKAKVLEYIVLKFKDIATSSRIITTGTVNGKTIKFLIHVSELSDQATFKFSYGHHRLLHSNRYVINVHNDEVDKS